MLHHRLGCVACSVFPAQAETSAIQYVALDLSVFVIWIPMLVSSCPVWRLCMEVLESFDSQSTKPMFSVCTFSVCAISL